MNNTNHLRQRSTRPIALCIVAVAVAAPLLVLAAAPAHAQDARDIITFRSDGHSRPDDLTWGNVTSESWEGIYYEGMRPKRDSRGDVVRDAQGRLVREEATETFYPWDIEGIKYGEAPDSYSTAYSNFTNGQHRPAAEGFRGFISRDSEDAIDDDDDTGVALTYAAFYYYARSYVEIGQAKDRYGEEALKSIVTVFRIDLSSRARERRDREYNRDRTKIDSVRSLILRATSQLVSNLTANSDLAVRGSTPAVADYRTRVEAATTAEELHELVLGFRTLYRTFSNSDYTSAVNKLKELLDPTSDFQDDFPFAEIKPRVGLDIYLTLADALHGLGDIGGVRNTDEALQKLEDIRSMSVTRLVNRLQSRNPRATFYKCLAKQRAAKIYEERLDFSEARQRWLDVQDASRTFADESLMFAGFFNDANLHYGLCYAKGGQFSNARTHLLGILEPFLGRDPTRDIADDFDAAFVLDPATADLYAGALLGLGDIHIDEYRKEGREELQLAGLHYYLQVTALFSAGEKTAEALYKAAQTFRELADEVSGLRPRDAESPSPYDYYSDTAKQLEEQLRENYANSPWAVR